MKAMVNSRMLYYVRRAGIMLTIVALIMGIVGCGPSPVVRYDLAISSTDGGEVTVPGEGVQGPYDAGTVVNLVAEPEEDYEFAGWTGDVETVADGGAATTTVTMNGDYSITANFAIAVVEIRTWHDLAAIRNNPAGHYVLMNDLDATTSGYAELAGLAASGGRGWEPIGGIEFDPGTQDFEVFDPFVGTLDGQGYEIRDLYINRPDEDGVGLFGAVEGSVDNVGIAGAAVTGGMGVGALVGANSGSIGFSYSTGSVSGEGGVGGLAGGNGLEGMLSNSYSNAAVTGGMGVGGLTGGNVWGGAIVECYSTGSVTGDLFVGGLVGINDGATITSSFSTGNVAGNEDVGGLVGATFAAGTVSDSFWDVTASGMEVSSGGTGKTTAEMMSMATFAAATWDITAVPFGETDGAYTWNIVDGQSHPFLSWEQAREPLVQYNLTISSGDGGEVVSPGEGTFTYDAGAVVQLAAEALEGYRFVNWTGDTDTVASVSFASTSITVNDNYAIIANFEELDPARLFAGGTGTVGDPYQLAHWHHLRNIRYFLSAHYKLTNDLDSATDGYEELASVTADGGRGWEPIGNYDHFFPPSDAALPFSGVFDGQRHQIRDVFIDRPDQSNVGLFSYLSWGGSIKNVGVVNVDVTGGISTGGLLGFSAATVSNSYCSGTVRGTQWVGGLVGRAGGTVTDSYFAGTITGQIGVGGLVGSGQRVFNSFYNYEESLINGESIITLGALPAEAFNRWLADDKFLDVNESLSEENGYYLITNVSDFRQLLAFGQQDSLRFRLTNDLDLTDHPGLYVPCLAADFDGNGHRISNLSLDIGLVYNVGLFGCLTYTGRITRLSVDNASVVGNWYVGSLAGMSFGSVSDSYATGSITGNEFVGGLVGRSFGTVNRVYSSGSVTGESRIGGLTGDNTGTVSNSYSSASVTGSWAVGGLVGMNWGDIADSYSSGSVVGRREIGGLVGLFNDGTVANSFWDVETSGMEESDGGMGKATAQMKDIATFSGAGWRIVGVASPGVRNTAYTWNMVDGQTYPFLSWQPIS